MLFSQAAQHVIETGRLPERLIALGVQCRATICTQVFEPQKATISRLLTGRQSVSFEFCFRSGAAVWSIRYLATAGDDTYSEEFNPYISSWLMEVATQSLKAADFMNKGDAI